MKRKTIAMLSISIAMIAFGNAMVFGQEAEVVDAEPRVMTVIDVVTALGSFVAAGVFYSASGWIKKVRQHLTGQISEFDWGKLGKAVALGVVLGFAAMIASIYMGETIIIEDIRGFIIQAGLNSTAILFIDKWIIARSSGPSSSANTEEIAGGA